MRRIVEVGHDQRCRCWFPRISTTILKYSFSIESGWGFIKENKKERKQENKNLTKKVIKKKIKFFLFSWSLSWSRSCFLSFFLVFRRAFLVQFLFSCFVFLLSCSLLLIPTSGIETCFAFLAIHPRKLQFGIRAIRLLIF